MVLRVQKWGGLLLLAAALIVLAACEPPTGIVQNVRCDSNVFMLTYTATNDTGTTSQDYATSIYMLQGSSPDVMADKIVGLAGSEQYPPGYFPPGYVGPAMPSEATGDVYSIAVPIVGPNNLLSGDPWAAGTQFYAVITYEIGLARMAPPVTCTADESESGRESGEDSVEGPQFWEPGDSRINRDPGALAAIYPISYGARGTGLHIYRVMPDGVGVLALEVTPEMLAAAPELPESYMIIARSEDGYVELARLPTGQYQLNAGPDGEGKIHVVVFDGLQSGATWIPFTVSVN